MQLAFWEYIAAGGRRFHSQDESLKQRESFQEDTVCSDV
jgi:hypothetical protein